MNELLYARETTMEVRDKEAMDYKCRTLVPLPLGFLPPSVTQAQHFLPAMDENTSGQGLS